VITILHSLSIIRLATAEAENPAKNNGMYGSILAQAKMKQLIQGSLVNTNPISLVILSRKTFAICKPLMQL
jgi:hypothetical protein